MIEAIKPPLVDYGPSYKCLHIAGPNGQLAFFDKPTIRRAFLKNPDEYTKGDRDEIKNCFYQEAGVKSFKDMPNWQFINICIAHDVYREVPAILRMSVK